MTEENIKMFSVNIKIIGYPMGKYYISSIPYMIHQDKFKISVRLSSTSKMVV